MRKLKLTALAALFCVCTGAVTAQENRMPPTGAGPSAAVVASAGHASATGPSPPADMPRRDPRYRLCASDMIALAFPLTPEFSQTINVGPDGFASLAGVGEVRLEGLSVQEATAAIRKAYAPILHDPIVTVELKEFNKPHFIVTGQVNRPGKYDLRGRTSATQAIGIAGGFNEAAKHSQVLLFRRVNTDWYEVKPINLKRILSGHDVNEDPEIHPGDMLFVPQNALSKIKRYIPSTGFGAYYQLQP